jgi:hypothetical protein
MPEPVVCPLLSASEGDLIQPAIQIRITRRSPAIFHLMNITTFPPRNIRGYLGTVYKKRMAVKRKRFRF